METLALLIFVKYLWAWPHFVFSRIVVYIGIIFNYLKFFKCPVSKILFTLYIFYAHQNHVNGEYRCNANAGLVPA